MKNIFEIINFAGFVKKTYYIEVREHCHLTGKYRNPALKKCFLIKDTSKKLFSIAFQKKQFFSGLLFFKKLIHMKKDINEIR